MFSAYALPMELLMCASWKFEPHFYMLIFLMWSLSIRSGFVSYGENMSIVPWLYLRKYKKVFLIMTTPWFIISVVWVFKTTMLGQIKGGSENVWWELLCTKYFIRTIVCHPLPWLFSFFYFLAHWKNMTRYQILPKKLCNRLKTRQWALEV